MGTQDGAFPIASVQIPERRLRGSGVATELFRYDAEHAFANKTADSTNLPSLKCDPQAKASAW